MRLHLFLIGLVLAPLFSNSAHAVSNPIQRDYPGFILWLDCEAHHGAIAFYYELDAKKGGSRSAKKAFRFDRKVPLSCQPQSWRSYRTTTVNPADGTWDRGLLVPSRHMDEKGESLKATFFLTNTLPQASSFNRGAWHRTEVISDCLRAQSRLKIWGGVIWGANKENDFFTVTHGIETPDYWWKLIYRSDHKRYLAWVFPNSRSAKAENIDRYRVSLDRLKTRVDFMPPIDPLEDGEMAVDPSGKNGSEAQSEHLRICLEKSKTGN